jgi:hypothetical protein
MCALFAVKPVTTYEVLATVALVYFLDIHYSLLPLRYLKMRSMINLVVVVVPEAAKLDGVGAVVWHRLQYLL